MRVLAHGDLVVIFVRSSGPPIVLRTTCYWMMARFRLRLAGAYNCLFVGE